MGGTAGLWSLVISRVDICAYYWKAKDRLRVPISALRGRDLNNVNYSGKRQYQNQLDFAACTLLGCV